MSTLSIFSLLPSTTAATLSIDTSPSLALPSIISPLPQSSTTSSSPLKTIQTALVTLISLLLLFLLLLTLYLLYLRRRLHRLPPSSPAPIPVLNLLPHHPPLQPSSTISCISSISSKATRSRPGSYISPVPVPPPPARGICIQREMNVDVVRRDGARDYGGSVGGEKIRVDVERANGYWGKGENAVPIPVQVAGLDERVVAEGLLLGVEDEGTVPEKRDRKGRLSLRDRLSEGRPLRDRMSLGSMKGSSPCPVEWVIKPRSPRRVVDKQVREMSQDWRKTYGW